MIKCRREFVTPEKARSYLELNKDNIRDMNRSKVRQYVSDMKAGLWQDNGQTIAFYANGKLFDGQHRLQAISESGVPIWLWIIEGLDNDVYITDIGYARLTNQIAHVSASAAGLATVILQKAGRATNEKTKAEIILYARQHKNLLETIAHLGKTMKSSTRAGRSFTPTGNGAAMLALLAAMIKGIAGFDGLEAFCRCSNSGLPIDGNDCSSPLMLRKMFIEGYQGEDGLLRAWKISKGSDLRNYTSITYQAITDFSKSQKVKKRYDPSKIDFEDLRSTVLNGIDALEIKLNLVT